MKLSSVFALIFAFAIVGSKLPPSTSEVAKGQAQSVAFAEENKQAFDQAYRNLITAKQNGWAPGVVCKFAEEVRLRAAQTGSGANYEVWTQRAQDECAQQHQ
jgi:nitroimidazol reductase NimA-like FMN-containing flavoprotein (pyridoxamine 5'-phosphate oxidase superfamily)